MLMARGAYQVPMRATRGPATGRREVRTEYLDQLLHVTKGRIGPAAELAGMTTRNLYDKMRRYGLRKEDYF